MAAQTHACGADSAIACSEREQRVDGEGRIFVVGRNCLLNLISIAGVGTRDIVGESFVRGELVVGGGRCDYVALAGNLAGETCDGTGYLVC